MRTPSPTLVFYCFVCTAIFLLQTGTAWTQVYGCKDRAAINYNASATINDGSCQYTITHYTPPVKVNPLSNALPETSGLQWAGNHLWSFNDSGNDAVLFRMDTTSNAILQTVVLGGATNVDWEDIAFDGTHFYIGDVGNNNGARTDLRIYKFPLSAIPDPVANPSVTISAAQIDVINFRYSDQPQPPVTTGSNNTRFDCEAMIVDEGKIHLFTKNWTNNSTTHYVITGTSAGTYMATPLEILATGYLVTAADKAPGSNVVMLLGYQTTGSGLHFLHVLSDYSNGLYFNGNKRRIDLPHAGYMGQAEGITFRTGTYGYISNERLSGEVNGQPYVITQKLRLFNTNDFLSALVLPLVLKTFSVEKINGTNRVQWHFATPVKQLQVQFSIDRTNFAALQTYAGAAEGFLVHPQPGAATCYRLAWQNAQGAMQYSEIKCVNRSGNIAVSNAVLQRNGELLVTKTGTGNGHYLFRLMTTEGKVVAQTAWQPLATGVNRINFMKNLSANSLLVLEVVSREERSSVLLKVQ